MNNIQMVILFKNKYIQIDLLFIILKFMLGDYQIGNLCSN